MNKNQCKDCLYFLQHYTARGDKIFRVYRGHCTREDAIKKRPDAIACEHYICGYSQENSLTSKTTLNKALRKYVLSLESLPEIDDE